MQYKIAVLGGLWALAATGCATTRQRDYTSTHPLTASEQSQQDALWDAAQDVFLRHRFSLDRVDRVAGVMTTFPVTSQHWFEVWRSDVATFRDAMESSINPIRRWVEVSFARGDDGAWNEVAVVVHKERLSSPDRQFNSTGSAYQYFSDSLPATTGQYRVTIADDRWLDLGRDPAMEDRLLRKITATCPTPEPESERGAEATRRFQNRDSMERPQSEPRAEATRP